MPAPKKQLIHDAKNYAVLLTKLEDGKSKVKMGDMREVVRKMTVLEAALILGNYKSSLAVIRADARKLAAKFKKTKNVKEIKSVFANAASLTFKRNKKG